MTRDKMNAIILANAMAYTSPSYDRSSASKKQQIWDKFLNSLTWEKIERKGKDHPIKSFLKMGIVPIMSQPKSLEKEMQN